MKYKYADFVVELSKYEKEFVDITLENYCYKKEAIDVFLDIRHEDILQELELSEIKYTLPSIALYSAAVQRKFAEWLPLHNAFVLHSACFDVCGEGVVFAAHSGTGKTTHMLLWQKLLGDKMTIVNGDKPIVRFFEDEPNVPYAYGTPWNGKERLGSNMRTPVKHICFIERSETKYVEKMDKQELIDRLFNQIYMPREVTAMNKTVELIERLLSCCSLWKIHCNMDVSAAEVAYNTIFGKF